MKKQCVMCALFLGSTSLGVFHRDQAWSEATRAVALFRRTVRIVDLRTLGVTLIDYGAASRSLWNVFYDTPQGTKIYCLADMPQFEALRQVEKFKERYLEADGTGKVYPNGRGRYPFTNVRVECVECFA